MQPCNERMVIFGYADASKYTHSDGKGHSSMSHLFAIMQAKVGI